ncbi:hypothetical protein [Lacticaseibacillus suilingensis]|uniref:hypothetical protein n=1 Tax=Lacticaseibacillus suilingensis TaxID=2799577 RepID=UPI0022E27C0A|nr:hypothetical protein [Lacticaseibacillus suilingensis]
MLIKLDSGDYINTEAVDSIKSGDDPYLVMRCGDVISITPADRDRIVEAMDTKDSQSIYIDAVKLADIELNDLTRKQRGFIK